MNPWMNTNGAANNMEREKQDANHKAAIGKLTEIVREAQQAELPTLRTENAALKEQVAHWESQYNQISFVLDSTERDKEELEETIAQQAEAIRLKDAAIAWIQKRCAGEAMPNWENTPHTGHSRGLILDRTNHALAIQPSSDILQARDERVAEACAVQATNWGNARLDDNGGHALRNYAASIRSGEWRKYLTADASGSRP